MDGIENQILSFAAERDALREKTDILREGWSRLEERVFSLLLKAGIRPQFLRYRNGGGSVRYLRIDWLYQKLTEVEISEYIVDGMQLDAFGNLAGGDERNESDDKGVSDVSGIASTF